MAGHSHLRLPAEEPPDFGPRTAKVARLAQLAGLGGLALAVVLGIVAWDAFRTFYFAYLAAFGFFLAIALGGLFFTLIHHVARAGWSVNIRRVSENLAGMLPVLAVLSLPIFVSVLIHKGDLYRWALPASEMPKGDAHHASAGPAKSAADVHLVAAPGPAGEKGGAHPSSSGEDAHAEHADHESDPGFGHRTIDPITAVKRAWLNPIFFCVRLVIYFGLWTLIARYYLRRSVQQDEDGDYRHTVALQKWSALSLCAFGLTVTFAAWDMFMSLDPHWYSTMFGVYYFAGAVVLFFASMVVIINLLQRAGYLREAVTTEHFHDLGKYMFAFTFFWGYVTFSQYMLIWYASIPEEVGWPARHGMSGVNPELNLSVNGPHILGNQWQWWSVMILFCCLLIPFAGLLSRHVKRNRKGLLFWACWLLFFHFCNIIWIVLPEMRLGFKVLPLIATFAAWIGLGGILTAAWIKLAARHRLRPINDPRVYESAAFVNI